MSLNTSHASNGVLMHANEYILLYVEKVILKFCAPRNKAFEGIKHGCIYMTSHRLIFNNKNEGDLLQSFSAPYIGLLNINVLQPNSDIPYFTCCLNSQPNGNFEGEVKLKIKFEMGDVYKFGEAVRRACKLAKESLEADNKYPKHGMAPYSSGDGWAEASFQAFKRPPGYYGWVPEQREFSKVPLNFVYISQDSPPFPGIGAPPRYEPEFSPVPVSRQTSYAYNGARALGAKGFDGDTITRHTYMQERNMPWKNYKENVHTNIWDEEAQSEAAISDF